MRDMIMFFFGMLAGGTIGIFGMAILYAAGEDKGIISDAELAAYDEPRSSIHKPRPSYARPRGNQCRKRATNENY